MNLLAKTLILLSLNVLVFGAVPKRNATYFQGQTMPSFPPQFPPLSSYMCYDIRMYERLYNDIMVCIKTRWHPFDLDQMGYLLLREKRDCCHEFELNLYRDRMIRRECEVEEPRYTQDVMNGANALNRRCAQLGFQALNEQDCKTNLNQQPMNSLCDQAFSEMPLATTTDVPLQPEKAVKDLRGSADNLCGIPVLLAILLVFPLI